MLSRLLALSKQEQQEASFSKEISTRRIVKNLPVLSRTSHLLLAAVVGCALFSTVALHADDTEVFFGKLDPSLQIKPNVLFALDTSGSMNWGTNDAPGGTEKRITRLKTALKSILQGATNLNVGMMRFNGAEGGGAMLYPVTDLEKQICLDDECGEVTDLQRIAAFDDDTEQNMTSGDITLNGLDLSMGDDQSVGLRFEGVNIPSGATVTEAVLEFTSVGDFNAPADLTISVEASDNSPEFTNANNDLNGRARESATRSWIPGSWAATGTYESADLTPLLQQVVDRAGWCGGNAVTLIVEGTGIRSAISADNDANQAPALRVKYNTSSVGPGEGCRKTKIVSKIRERGDDAWELTRWNHPVVYHDHHPVPKYYSYDTILGLRFQKLAISQGAQITNAYLEFEINAKRTGAVTLGITGGATDDAAIIYNPYGDIASRPRTAAKVDWEPPEADRNEKVRTPDISPIIQEIVNRSNWKSHNSIALYLAHESGNGFREFESYDGEPSNAPALVIELVTNGINAITARDILVEEVDNLKVLGGTPILDVLYEANQYFTGRPVDYGRTRGNPAINHPHYPDQRHSYHRVSHPESFTGGTTTLPQYCDGWGSDLWSCRTQQINGNAVYTSPMQSNCQSNHIVLLSDGVPSWQSAVTKAKTRAGITTCEQGGSFSCITDFAEWMAETDHALGIPDEQNITTYTIGFGSPGSLSFLEDVAEAGHGEFFGAVTAEDLESAFNQILADVLDVDTTFVAPGATVNQFNRLTHRNDIYFSLFKPKDSPIWGGNLKKYKIKTYGPNEIKIVGADDAPAVDEDTGFFSADSVSFWSDVQDGTDVELGGAAGELSLGSASNPRKVYTYTGGDNVNDSLLTTAANALHETNTNITKAMLGIEGEDNLYRQTLLEWARGMDVYDEDSDGQTNDVRLHMGDPMHSRPLIVNYNGNGGASSLIYVATNEGFLHAINHDTGTEKFAFIPKELLYNLDDFYKARSTTPHPYGLDGDISSWFDDANNNTMVDPGESAYLFFGMRRGGGNYYAMDVSNPDAPELKWVIRGGAGGTPGYEELGQTWSKLSVSSIRYNNQDAKPVLIFGGGYDINQDASDTLDTQPKRTDNAGRSIYIADLETGDRLWSASSQNEVGNHLELPDMEYSIPGNIRVVDIDFDGNADQMYASDMGGQVWRFDINSTDPAAPLVKGGVLADLSGTSAADARRFYYEPDVSLVSKDGIRFLSVAIGSGWRAHPLDEVIQDRIYMLRVDAVYSAPEGYGHFEGSGGTGVWSPIEEGDLLDVTDNVSPSITDILDHSGWMIRLEGDGEKILSESITVNNQLIFTSYLPSGEGGLCEPAAGSGKVYVLNVFDGSPTVDLNGSGDGNMTKEDRNRELKHGGIPPAAAALISEEGVPVVLVGPEQPLEELKFGQLTQKTWWQEVHNEH